MFKTIFGKQFAAYIAMLTVSFLALGLVLVNLFQGYFYNRQKEDLTNQCQKVAQTLQSLTTSGLPSKNVLQLVYNLSGTSFLYVSSSGTPILTPDITLDVAETFISNSETNELSRVFNGEHVTVQGTMSGVFPQNSLIVGYPVQNTNLYTGQTAVVGALFMDASVSEITDTTRDVIRIMLVCLIVTAGLSFILIYFTSRTISRPIRKINEAAKQIAGGDFEKRLTVQSRDEVGQLSGSFNHMAESLNNQEIRRREFIANVSHDLRSPLTSIRGYLQAIQDGTVPPEKQGHYLGVVLDETERLSKMANDLLEINKVRVLDIDLNRSVFDINEVVRKTVVMLEQRITGKDLETTLAFEEGKTLVNADSQKIQRVIYNLLDNAIKFTPEKGILAVETALDLDKNKVKVAVKDSGIGVSEEDQKRIFERFFKADASRGADTRGSGLGLAIVREFIQAHGEMITLESKSGEGCKFEFTLPLAEEER